MHRPLIAVIFCLAGAVAFAQDTPAERAAAADRYLKIVPMSQLLDDTFAEMSKRLPPEKRSAFLRQMKVAVRADSLERIARASMIKHFTADELNALADFYGSKEGASAMKKFGGYMAEVMPAIQAEVLRGAQQLNNEAK